MLVVQKKLLMTMALLWLIMITKSILKNLNSTIKFYKNKRKENWISIKKNCRLQIQKNFSIPNMANTHI